MLKIKKKWRISLEINKCSRRIFKDRREPTFRGTRSSTITETKKELAQINDKEDWYA